MYTVNVKIFVPHKYLPFSHTKKLVRIYQHVKIMLLHCLLLPKYAVRESYNPKMVALHEYLHAQKYPRFTVSP